MYQWFMCLFCSFALISTFAQTFYLTEMQTSKEKAWHSPPAAKSFFQFVTFLWKNWFIFLRISVSFNFPLSWENSLKENYFMILMKLRYFWFHNYLFSSTFLIYRNNLSQIIKWIACSNNREVCWQYLISNYNRSYL